MVASPKKSAKYAIENIKRKAVTIFIPPTFIFETQRPIIGESQSPAKTEPNKKTKEVRVVEKTAPALIDPEMTIPLIMERMTNPKISSMTAAPKIIFASAVASLPKSFMTRAVMPTEVAVKVAPIKRCVPKSASGKIQRLTKYPKIIGATTPIMATINDEAPTFAISLIFDSSPT